MAQLSRPFQIALVAVLLLAGVWLFALQGHSSSPSSSTSASNATPTVTVTTQPTAPVKPAHAAAGAQATHTLHGSARHSSRSSAAHPSTPHAGTSASTATHGASSDSAAHHSAGAPATTRTPATHKAAGTHTSATASTGAHAPAKHAAAPAKPTTATKAPATKPSTPASRPAATATGAPSGQRTVEAQLAKGNVVLLLFWNPKGTDDNVMHQAVQQVRQSAHGIAVEEASASQVGRYGSVTRGVQVSATPTLLVINKHGQAVVLTGVQDAYAVEQAIEEARQSSSTAKP